MDKDPEDKICVWVGGERSGGGGERGNCTGGKAGLVDE